MGLIYKELADIGRSMYLYYPSLVMHSPLKYCSITFLREDNSEESVLELIDHLKLKELAQKEGVVCSFPNPLDTGWNYSSDPTLPDDIKAIAIMQSRMNAPIDKPLKLKPNGIPMFEALTDQWHLMDDTKYIIGIDSGASMLYTLIALNPDQIAAACLVGGSLPDKSRQGAFHSPVASYLINAAPEGIEFICNEVNHTRILRQEGQHDIYTSPINAAETVIVNKAAVTFDAECMSDVWNKLFKCTRRTNTGAHGDTGPRMNFATVGFEIYNNDSRLGDQNNLPHAWITHVPEKVGTSPNDKLPLLLFFHGASDTPAEAAEMSKFHELGAQEGFITVYPWSSNTVTWNIEMDDDGFDDISYVKALIDYMLLHYPIDSKRIYLSGFSNGAAMAQSFALMYPEMIAAICHIDSNWPGSRTGESNVDFSKIPPMAEGLRKKEIYDYRMPVWYTYGTREPSYPVYRGCTQQHQYDFWKIYNNITVKETPTIENPDPSGCGVIGDKRETLWPSERFPHHMYDVHRFYSNDPIPQNYYNYVMMHDKGHDVAPMDAALGWNYVKHFKRNPDGSIGII